MLLIIFPCNGMVSSAVNPINTDFVTIREKGHLSSKIIKKFLGKVSLKHLLSVS